MDDFLTEPPTSIDPYQVLQVPISASPADIRTAYKKLALKSHPDKVPPDLKSTAHETFQSIAFAYAILSSPQRRARYDATGSTSESLLDSSESFSWPDFFRAQFADLITGTRLNDIKSTYQHSEEERNDVIKAFKQSKGKMDRIFLEVMMSNTLEDEDRFRGYIDAAIEAGQIEGYDAYVNEPAKARERRRKKALREKKQAEEHAKKIGVYDKLFGNVTAENGKENEPRDGQRKSGKRKNDEASLAALLSQRAESRSAAFFDQLEAKYANKNTKAGKKSKKKEEDELPEEAFQAAAARLKKRCRAATPQGDEDKEDEEDVSLKSTSSTEKSNQKNRKARQKLGRTTKIQGSKKRRKGVELADEDGEQGENSAKGPDEDDDEEDKAQPETSSKGKRSKRQKTSKVR